MSKTFRPRLATAMLVVPMLATCLASPNIACADDGPNAGSGGSEPPPELHYAPRPDEMLVDEIQAAVREAKQRPPAAEALIPEMAILYRELAFAESLPRYKREELQKKLEYYMIELGLFVIDDYRRQERKRPHRERGSLGQRLAGGKQNDGSEGGAAMANAQDLIDLITSTIAPESWDINGGIGSIHYYSLTPALVVRQTGTTQADVNRLMQGLR